MELARLKQANVELREDLTLLKSSVGSLDRELAMKTKVYPSFVVHKYKLLWLYCTNSSVPLCMRFSFSRICRKILQVCLSRLSAMSV